MSPAAAIFLLLLALAVLAIAGLLACLHISDLVAEHKADRGKP